MDKETKLSGPQVEALSDSTLGLDSHSLQEGEVLRAEVAQAGDRSLGENGEIQGRKGGLVPPEMQTSSQLDEGERGRDY